ncbi:MAG: hypothetical protein ACI4GC_06630 [Acutalibacteraceae bacterium]
MDETNNKPVDGEAREKELIEELEEIRDMFQEALDNASNESEHQGELIQELEDEPEAPLEEEEVFSKRKKACECCGENFFTDDEDKVYCENCRELMKRYPIRLGGILTVAAMICVFFISVVLCSDKLDKSITTLELWDALRSGQAFSAADTAYSLGTGESDSKNLDKMIIESYWRAGYITNATQYIQSIYSDEEIAKNKDYTHKIEATKLFAATKEKADVIVSDAFSGKDYDYEKVLAELNELAETKVSEDSEQTYSKAFIAYYKNELMRMNDVPAQEQLQMLLEVDEKEQEDYQWIYYPAICSTAARAGNEEVATEYFKKIKSNNAQDLNAYISMANYYRYLDEPDADKMLALCDEAAKAAYKNDVAYYPTMAIAYIIKGEGALALETMQTYMNSGYYTVANCNLYALCGLYCGNTDIYDSMKETLENSGYKLSDVVENYKAEKITIGQAIADKRGDIG